MDLKEALISPILKKPNLGHNIFKLQSHFQNFLSLRKLESRVVIELLNSHLQFQDLEKFQSAYKEKHSTETGFLKSKLIFLTIQT